MSGAFDLAAYRERIGLGDPHPSLGALHLAHTWAIPFENLDIHLGRPILLDLEALQAKLVAGRRGGYCFEQNSLFGAALGALGFTCRLREARVRRGATGAMARSHLALEVALEDGPWLADVGFGADGILGPVPLDGREVEHHGDRNRILAEGPRQVLQAWREGAWMDLYALEPSEVFPVDLKVANHYTSTHPDSKFTQVLTAQRCAPGDRATLRNLSLTRGGVTRDLDPAELLDVLEGVFGLAFPPGTRFSPPQEPPRQ
ncbi:arylamine N-acetyltransferase family protein [Mesoterricola silvestris]|uniref:Arylamine N-acetyltransferase n=1 Tax=Mesoterricola silvestris TaxID=2927979 RepID=A0AA48GN85_9BACT|nr:arylamine N-acetyltransferase [Mesoterricola silvestris]BDU74454.1 arylamine N-acetyltransferase [Mesoterricola silvestris]